MNEKPSVERAGKYLTYAIGEIVLVVIGILIALQINNWNEQRKESIEEQAILKRLETEFISNKEQLTYKIEHRKAIIKNCRRILEFYIQPQQVERDSILFYLSGIVPTTFDPIQNDLVRSGTIETLRNEELKLFLVNWSTDVIQLQEVEQMFLRYVEGNLHSYVTELGIQRDIQHYFWISSMASLLESNQVENLIPQKSNLPSPTKDELLADARLESIVAQSLNFNLFNNLESETLMKRIDAILEVLDSEIKE
jgi:hypothetical protein